MSDRILPMRSSERPLRRYTSSGRRGIANEIRRDIALSFQRRPAFCRRRIRTASQPSRCDRDPRGPEAAALAFPARSGRFADKSFREDVAWQRSRIAALPSAGLLLDFN